LKGDGLSGENRRPFPEERAREENGPFYPSRNRSKGRKGSPSFICQVERSGDHAEKKENLASSSSRGRRKTRKGEEGRKAPPLAELEEGKKSVYRNKVRKNKSS